VTRARALELLDAIIDDAQQVPICTDDEGWDQIEAAVRKVASSLGRVSLRAAGLLANIRRSRKASKAGA